MKTKKESQDYADKNETIQRLMSFVEKKGRPSAVAKMLGMSDNLFSNMIKRDAKPSSDVMVALANQFPDMDIHYILVGTPNPIIAELKKAVKEREEEANYHKSVVKQFVGKDKGATGSPRSNKDHRAEYARNSIRNVRNKPVNFLLPGSVAQPYYTFL